MAGNRNSDSMAGWPLYLCYGADHQFEIKGDADSPWVNQQITLHHKGDSALLQIDPAVAQTFSEQGVSWLIDCFKLPANAEVKAFQLWAQTEFTSPAYKVDVSLGHHRIDFVDASGNEQFQVIEYGEETILKAREISFYTKEAMPFPAKWKLEEQDLQPADPDATGWVTPYNFKPTKAGTHLINVTVPSLYYEQGYFRKEMPVHALALTPWGNDALIQVNDKIEPDVLERGVVCTRGQPLSLKLLNENQLLKGSSVSVKSADAKALGLTFNPDLNVERPMEGTELTWNLTSHLTAKSGLFKLQMHCSKLKRDWEITGHLLSANLKDEVAKIEVSASEVSDFGAVFFCKETRPLTITFAESMRGLSVALDETGNPDMTYDPPLKTLRKVPDNLKLEWQVTGGDRSSVFTLRVVCPDVETPLSIESRVLSKITVDEIQSLKINGQPVDLARPELLFFRAGTYTVELVPKAASSLIGLNVALKKGSGAELGMTYNPALNQARPLTQAGLQWTVTGGQTQSGLFELLIDVPQVEQSMPLGCRLLSSNLADEADVKIDGVAVPAGGNWFFRGRPQTVTLTPKPDSPLIGLPVTLTCTIRSGLDIANVVSTPAFGSVQATYSWEVRGRVNSGTFQLALAGRGMTTPIILAVSRLLSNDLADEADVKIDGVAVPAGSNWFYRDKAQTVTLTPKPDSPLAGLPVTLTCIIRNGLEIADVVSAPAFGSEQTTHSWAVTGRTKSGTFQLALTGKGMTTPITLAVSKLISSNLADEADVKIDGVAVPAGGNWFYRDNAQTVTLTPKPDSPLIGLPVTLTCTVINGLDSANVVSAPAFGSEQTTYSWAVTGRTNSGTFRLALAGKGMTTPITLAVSKLLSNNLADEAEVKIGDVAVPAGGNWFYRDKAQTVRLIPKPNSPLAGLPVTLTCTIGNGLVIADVVSAPAFGSEQTTYSWAVTGKTRSGTFQLALTGKSMTTPITLAVSKLLSNNLADEAEVKIGGVAVPAGGNWFYRDKAQTVTLTPKPSSPLAGLPVTLTCTIINGLDSANVVSAPAFGSEQTTYSWAVTGRTKSGTFRLALAGKGMTTPITLADSKLLSNNLADEADVKIDGVAVPAGGNWFFRDKAQTVTLTPKTNSPLAGLPVTLTCGIKSGLWAGDVVSAPAFGSGQTTYSWAVTGKARSGTFELTLWASGMGIPIILAVSKLISNNLADEIEVKIGGKSVPASGNVFIRGQAQELTLVPKPDSPITGRNITLTCKLLQGLSEGDIRSTPPFGGVGGPNWRWQLTGYNRSGTFEISVVGEGIPTPIKVAVSKLLSSNLADEAVVKIDGVDASNNEVPYLKNSKRIITLIPKPGSPLAGTKVNLRWLRGGIEPQDLSVSPSLNIDTTVYRWEVSSPSEKHGTFEFGLFVAELGTMLALPVSRKIIAKYFLNDKEISGIQTILRANPYYLRVEVSLGVSRIYVDGVQGKYMFIPELNTWVDAADGMVSWLFVAGVNTEPKQTVFFDYSLEYPAREKVEFVSRPA
jgi:hypothetical protein